MHRHLYAPPATYLSSTHFARTINLAPVNKERDMSDKLVTVSLSHVKDFQFEINYGDGMPVLLADEPPPLGAGLALHNRVLDASGALLYESGAAST
jgi:hypothetical protein